MAASQRHPFPGIGSGLSDDASARQSEGHDDFTYEDLDYTTSKTSALYPGGAGMSKGFFLGRVKKKVYMTNISHNAAEGPSNRQYMIDTDELANFMHQWFADRGYRYRGI